MKQKDQSLQKQAVELIQSEEQKEWNNCEDSLQDLRDNSTWTNISITEDKEGAERKRRRKLKEI